MAWIPTSLATPFPFQEPSPEPIWSEPDGTGDVELASFDGSPAAIAPDSPETRDVDLTHVSVLRETGVDVEFALGIVEPPSSEVVLSVCFQFGDVRFALWGAPDSPVALLRRGQANCPSPLDFGSPDGPEGTRLTTGLMRSDAENQRVLLRLPRTDLTALAGDAPLGPGAKLSAISAESFKVFTRTGHRTWLHDVAPTPAPASKDLDLTLPTHNVGVSVHATNTGPVRSCLRRGGDPVYVMEAETYTPLRAVVSSRLAGSAKLSLSGYAEAPGWTVRMVPEISLPAGPSQANLTVAIQPVRSAQKVCTLVHILATDKADPSRTGELVVEVIVQAGLSKELPSLFFHLDPQVSEGRGVYLNVFDEDPTASTPENSVFAFQRFGSRGGTEPTSYGTYQIRASTEFPVPYSVVLPWPAEFDAHISLSGQGATTNAHLSVGIGSGQADELLAFGEADVQIPAGAPQDYVVRVSVLPDKWRSSTRLIEAEKPLSITIGYQGRASVPPAPSAIGSGIVTWHMESSSLALEVLDTIRLNQIGLGVNDGIAYLAVADGNQTKRVSPARVIEFAFNLVYEADVPDTFTARVNASSPEWKVLQPTLKARIGPVGRDSVPVVLAVQAPQNATEGSEARFTLVVEGGASKARAEASVIATVAKDQVYGRLADARGPAQSVPSPALVVSLGVISALLAWSRRRVAE